MLSLAVLQYQLHQFDYWLLDCISVVYNLILNYFSFSGIFNLLIALMMSFSLESIFKYNILLALSSTYKSLSLDKILK